MSGATVIALRPPAPRVRMGAVLFDEHEAWVERAWQTLLDDAEVEGVPPYRLAWMLAAMLGSVLGGQIAPEAQADTAAVATQVQDIARRDAATRNPFPTTGLT